MTTETKPTQAHVKFAPLILPRKTPAEEARQLRDAWANADINASNAVDCLVELIDRLETPDAPKRWDGVWPWVGGYDTKDYPIIHFSDSLRVHDHPNEIMCFAYVVGRESVDHVKNQSPYHDGVIITITAGDGTEFPRVVRDSGKSLYLCLGHGKGMTILLDSSSGSYSAGHIERYWECSENSTPLPPGTVARITIDHTLPTTEQRYSVEVVEPKFEPITIGDTIVSAGDNWVEADYGCSISAHRFPIARAREYIAALTAAVNHLDPQEQPATVAVAEGLPLEMRCTRNSQDKIVFDEACTGELKVKVFQDADNCHGVLSPADEARLRNLLNQRAEGGGA